MVTVYKMHVGVANDPKLPKVHNYYVNTERAIVSIVSARLVGLCLLLSVY